MPTPATMEYIADLVVRRVLADAAAHGRPVSELLVERYPFSESDRCEHIWHAALARHGIDPSVFPKSAINDKGRSATAESA
jgi:hypothetical protein